MPWMGAAISVGGSLLGGALGGSKEGQRDAEDAQAAAMRAQEDARRDSMEALSPYLNTGSAASLKLSQLLGIADPVGYAPKPTRQQFEDQAEHEHYLKYGGNYDRNSSMGTQNLKIDKRYKKAMEEWEKGKAAYIAANPNSQGEGELLRSFSNADFVKDPGYEFRLAEGEKGIQRQLSAMGGFRSGAALKAIDRYNQDYASNEFSNAYNRDAANKARTFSFLSGASGQGLQAAGTGANVNQNAANANQQAQLTTANNLYQMGQNREDNQFNAITSAIGNGIYAYNRNQGTTTANTDGSSWYSSASSKGNPQQWWEMT
jgi:hypothetical protein